MPRWVYRSILIGLMLLAVASVARFPAATNDGPAHLAFSNLLATMRQPNHPLQQQAYSISLRPNPNLAVYLLMAAMLRVFSPATVESIVQILCLIGPITACWFAIRMIDPEAARNVWLAVFILPLTLNQMFFLGLYNHCISMAVFFLVVGTYFWMIKSPSFVRALALAACLVLTFLCHASGFIMAFAGVTVLSGTSFTFSLLRDRRLIAALRQQRYALTALLAPLPLAALFLASGGKGNTAYGDGIRYRLKKFATLQILAVDFHRDTYVAWALSAILLAAFVIVTLRILARREQMPEQRRELAIATIAAALVSAAIMMAFPDSMGGGWTHFRRFEIFPFFWGILILAFHSYSLRIAAAMMAAGATTGVLLMSTMIMRQTLIHQELAPLAEIDRQVGSHCTVLPIVLEKKPWDETGKPVWIDYQPYFHSTSRLELTGDRVVLFNYLARLDVYPIRFRPNFEPQSHIFHWPPRWEKTTISTIDIDGFEASSGVKVDYILQWGFFNEVPEDLRQQTQSATSQFDAVYKSPDGSATLFHRRGGGNNFCTAPAVAGN